MTPDFQLRLKKAITMADTAIYGTARDLPGAWDKISSAFENVFTLGTLTETKQNIARLYQTAIDNWESRKKILWTMANQGTYEGKPVAEQQEKAAFYMIESSIKEAKGAISLVNQYAKGDILPGAIKDTFGKIAEVLGNALDGVLGLAKAAGTTIKWLPWIIGGALVIPLLLRTFSAYKRGGASAAADEAAGQIERGRAAAGRAVATGARALAPRGVAGMRRSRRGR